MYKNRKGKIIPTDKEKYNKIFWIILILINICILLILFIIMFSSKDYSVNQKKILISLVQAI